MDEEKLTVIAVISSILLACLGIVIWQIWKVATWEHVSYSIDILKLVIQAIIWVFLIGVVLSIITNKAPIDKNITLIEFVIWMAVFTLIAAPVTTWYGWNKSMQSRLIRNELWHGSETDTSLITITCSKDGPCLREYSCDPYPCNPHPCNCRCTSRDDDGSCRSETCDTCWDTCYHDCPYCTEEIVTVVHTTLGDYTIDDHIFTENPVAWRSGHNIPTNIQRGPSQFWLDAKDRVENNEPGPVTKIAEYENPILASDYTIFENYSAAIQTFLDMGVLPSPVENIYSFYRVDQVDFVGYSPANPNSWQRGHEYLNAAFGDDLHGDLRVVVVQNQYIEDYIDEYLIALKYHWQDEIFYGDDLASKNTVILVLTTNGSIITKARAITGMPVGNEYMLERTRYVFEGQSIDPTVLYGNVTGDIYTKTYDDGRDPKLAVEYEHQQPGLVEDWLWGITDPETKFERVSMSGNFKYLWKETKPKPEQQNTVRFWVIFLGLIGWGVAIAIGEKDVWGYRKRSSQRNMYR